MIKKSRNKKNQIRQIKEKSKNICNNTKLGKEVSYNFEDPSYKILNAVENPHSDIDYLVRFSCPEFTSICPITSQPDFAHLIIDYIPNKKIVESKSLKMYLFAYRNHGAFHENCTVQIAKDIIKIINPKWLRIGGYWYPRGGIPIDIFFQTSNPPADIWLPDQEISVYKPRN
jgi:7-cyano-7-deazaguanine reductase